MVKLYGEALYNIIVTDSMIIIMMVIQNGHNLIRCGHVFKVFVMGKSVTALFAMRKFVFFLTVTRFTFTSLPLFTPTKQNKQKPTIFF